MKNLLQNNKVLLFIDNMNSGGAERQMSYLAIGLKKWGYNVRLIKFYSGKNFYESDLSDYGIITEVMVSGKNKFKRPFVMMKIIREWSPAGVICYKDGVCMSACIARMFTRFNLIVSERNTTQTINRSERLKFFLYRWADHIVPNSYSQGDFIRQRYRYLTERISIVTNMIDTTRFSVKTMEKKSGKDVFKTIGHRQILFNQIGPKFNVVTIARVSPQKNVLEYLDAVSEIKKRRLPINFNWYGDKIDADYWERVRAKIDELGLNEIISFHDAQKEVVEVYHSADIFCLPSKYEGFPNVLCEAMSCGLPCIASNVCDNPKIMDSDEYLFKPDAPDIVKSIVKMTNLTRSEMRRIGESNRARIIELCAEKAFVEKYMELLQ